MRTTFATVVAIAVNLCAADMRVDHITFAGNNLAEMRKMFADGFPTEYGCRHSNGITEMALSSFPDGSYLELIAPISGADPSKHYWGAFMAKNAGPCAWAIRSTNLQPSVARLQSAGIAVATEKAGRKRPDGVELRWQTATVGPPPQGSFFPFMIADETSRDLRANPQGKPTSGAISGIRFVVVAVRDLPSAIAKYRSAFDLPEPQQQEDETLGARLAWFPGTPAILAAPTGDHTWLAERLKQFGEIPCAFIFGVLPSNVNGRPRDESKWFSRSLWWLNPADLRGARIAVTLDSK